MSQHVPETCNESSGLWLPLTQYSVKSGVSLSTIRRKIKSNSIPYRLENGRYLVLFQGKETRANYPNQTINTPQPKQEAKPEATTAPKNSSQKSDSVVLKAVPFMEKSVEMLSEAFELAIDEKDERIRLLQQQNQNLNEHIMELRLLVRVLEEKFQVRY